MVDALTAKLEGMALEAVVCEGVVKLSGGAEGAKIRVRGICICVYADDNREVMFVEGAYFA